MLKSILKISLATNQYHKLNFTIKALRYTASKIVKIESRKKIEERSVKELMGMSKKKFMDSNRYKTTVKRSRNTLTFKITFEYPWKVSVNQTDVLQVLFCNQQFPAHILRITNSAGCLQLSQNIPPQNYESEIIFISVIVVFAMIVMVILLFNHIKDILMNSRVFPFISLIGTPLIIMHVLAIDVKLAKVVNLLINRLL